MINSDDKVVVLYHRLEPKHILERNIFLGPASLAVCESSALFMYLLSLRMFGLIAFLS